MKHANISIFVPHNGCPEQCSFCNQRRITGQQKQPTPEEVTAVLNRAATELSGRTHLAEIAFFGGSFTAIDPDYMVSLLKVAQQAVLAHGFCGIRCSTRPDAIDDAVLSLLQSYGVTAIELGAQSMDEAVLRQNHRGHDARSVRVAAEKIRAAGIELGLQMMTGLPYDTPEKAMQTLESLLALQPDTLRIYPTIVLENTPLSQWYKAGTYRPQTLEEAVDLCARLIRRTEQTQTRVIRVGLHASQELEHRVAGPYHPAFMELCRSRIFYEDVLSRLQQQAPGTVQIETAPQNLSVAIGQKKENLRLFEEKGYHVEIRAAADLAGRSYRIVRSGR